MKTPEIDAPAPPARFSTSAIELDPARILRMLGYPPGITVRPQVVATAQAAAQLATAAASARATYRRAGIASCTRTGLTLSTGTRFRGPTFAANLEGCNAVIVFVLSLGARFDTAQRNLAGSGKTLEAHMMELAGWLAIEEATRRFRKHVQAEVALDGLVLRRRMAPGYTTRVDGAKAEWPLEDHPALFSMFEADALPARLLEGSCAMSPKMSRSGLFGLAPALPAGTTAACQETMEDE